MQIHRLFEIIYMLLERGSVTAKEFAERFEVSVRTVYRDVDTLSQAGIPIYAAKGRGGGIRLLDNYILNKSVLTEEEQKEILWGLQGLKAVQATEGEQTLSRLSSLFGRSFNHWIEVDFSDWTEGTRDTFHQLKQAILLKQVIAFSYYNSKGEKSEREAEPLQLWFKEKAWYLRGYCRKAGEMRLFKITRMKKVKILQEVFHGRELVPEPETEGKEKTPETPNVRVELKIEASQAFRVYDDFPEEAIQRQEDGSFLAVLTCPENEWVYGYILSYGPGAQVIRPERIRTLIKERLELMMQLY